MTWLMIIHALAPKRLFRTLAIHLVGLTLLPLAAGGQQAVENDPICVAQAATADEAQSGDASVLSGRVLGQGGPVANALVSLLDASQSCRTDAAGRFKFVGLRAGRYVLEIRRIGFVVLRDTVILRPHDEAVREITMKSNAAQLDTVRAKASHISPLLEGFEHRRTTGGIGHFITDSVLRSSESVSLPSLLRERIPGLQLVHYRGQEYIAAGRGGAVKFPVNPSDPKSPGACFPLIYMDGSLIYDGPPMGPPPITNFATFNLSGIEYYSGPATVPTQFKRITNPCGALLLWRRQH